MKPKEILSYTFSALMVVCMVFLIVILIRGEIFRPRQRQQSQTRQVQNWQRLEFTGYRYGQASAPVQIVEFFDYECPFCKASEPAIKVILRKYPQKVPVVYEDFPLESIYPYAYEAAIAAECAWRQNSFIAYHDSLFTNQARLGTPSCVRLAVRTGIADTTVFHRCVEDQKMALTIESSMVLGDSLGIQGTPTFIINDTLVMGELSI